MYLTFDRRKTRLETVLHTVSPSEVYCLWLYLEDGVLTLIIFRPFRTRSSGKGDNWCFCLVAIVIDFFFFFFCGHVLFQFLCNLQQYCNSAYK